jgi:hypothetical protein
MGATANQARGTAKERTIAARKRSKTEKALHWKHEIIFEQEPFIEL